jgi:hypothetical protein
MAYIVNFPATVWPVLSMEFYTVYHVDIESLQLPIPSAIYV